MWPTASVLVLTGLYVGQIVAVVAFAALGVAGLVPAWAAWTVVLIFAASFLVPELLGPLPIVAAAVAAVWSIVVAVEQGLIL